MRLLNTHELLAAVCKFTRRKRVFDSQFYMPATGIQIVCICSQKHMQIAGKKCAVENKTPSITGKIIRNYRQKNAPLQLKKRNCRPYCYHTVSKITCAMQLS